MDFFHKIVIFLGFVLVWYVIFYFKEEAKNLMQKILYIIAKGLKGKKDTSAGEDFLNNMNRDDPPPPVIEVQHYDEPVSIEPVSIEPTIEVQPNLPLEEEKIEEVKPLSEPKPTESPREISNDVVIRMEFPDLHDQTSMSVLEKVNTLILRMENINNTVQTLTERINHMALNLDALTAEVTRAKTVQASAIALITKVAAELETVSAELASHQHEPPVDTSGIDALAADLKASTDALAAAVADSVDVTPTHTVILNADNPAIPTVEVVLPEVLPEVVEASVEQVVETVDPASSEPQIQIVVEEAAPAVVEAVEAAAPEVVADPAQDLVTSEGETLETGVVVTDAGETNVTVATPPEEAAVADAAGVDVVEAVAEAYEAAPEVVAAPQETETVILNADNPAIPTVEVVLPEVLPEVVEASVEQVVDVVDPASSEPQFQIVVEEAAPAVVEAIEAAPAEVVADPAQDIVTPEGTMVTGVVETDAGQADVTVAVPVAEAAVAEAAGVDVVEAVAEAYETSPEVEAIAEILTTDNATTPGTGGAPLAGSEGTQSGEAPKTE